MKKRLGMNVILKLLIETYDRPKPYMATDPIDELVRTVLSQNTNDRNSLAAFAALKRNFKSWRQLLDADTKRIVRSIRCAGLANIKAGRIKNMLAEIKWREGRISLKSLCNMDTRSALDYLRSLKGVGPKTAACVLLFSFGKSVMPVDTHIFRVAKRLGIIKPEVSIEEAHEELTNITPKSLIYDLHLCIIEHGRRTCRAQNPRCGFCVLYNICGFKDKRIFKGGQN
jgi:endonuclease-3